MVSQECSVSTAFYSFIPQHRIIDLRRPVPPCPPPSGLGGTETEGSTHPGQELLGTSTHPGQELLGTCVWRGRRDTGAWAPGLPTQTPIISLLGQGWGVLLQARAPYSRLPQRKWRLGQSPSSDEQFHGRRGEGRAGEGKGGEPPHLSLPYPCDILTPFYSALPFQSLLQFKPVSRLGQAQSQRGSRQEEGEEGWSLGDSHFPSPHLRRIQGPHCPAVLQVGGCRVFVPCFGSMYV